MKKIILLININYNNKFNPQPLQLVELTDVTFNYKHTAEGILIYSPVQFFITFQLSLTCLFSLPANVTFNLYFTSHTITEIHKCLNNNKNIFT